MMDLKYSAPVILKHIPDDSHNFKPLPEPTGKYPYRISIEQIPGKKTEDLRNRMAFHMVGDTGSARHSDFQALVASSLARQAASGTSAEGSPSFLYHLGDIVYNHGEAHEFPAQFLKPYEEYGAPIFAIAGNHDGDINPANPVPYRSLDAFMEVFCSTDSRPVSFGNGSKRLSMSQPHVYWTLETPLARFIGLYANVNKHGIITEEQRDWFIEELKYAEREHRDQALFVCIHHAPYSADTNHGSSPAMISFLDSSYIAAGVKPDAVFSGHVHNYQRFSAHHEDGTTVPHIVSGAGGYADLHAIANTYDSRVEPLPSSGRRVRLDAYCDNCFGFLKIDIEKVNTGLRITGEYYTLPSDITEPDGVKPRLYDRFVIPVKRRAYSRGLYEN
jgi:hypothetical protein